MAWTTRKSLIDRVIAGDEESWETFYIAYSRLIFAIGGRSGLAQDQCHDLVQEVMRSVFKNRSTFRYDEHIGRFRAYLTAVIRHKISDMFRAKSAKGIEISECENEIADENDTLTQKCNEEWRTHIINVALLDLKDIVDPVTFDAFQMYVLQEKEPDKVSRALGISVSAVYVYKNRCVAHLKRIISSYSEKDPEFRYGGDKFK